MNNIAPDQAVRIHELATKSRRASRTVDALQRAVGRLGDAMQALHREAVCDPEVLDALHDDVRRQPLEASLELTEQVLAWMHEHMPIRRRGDDRREISVNWETNHE